MGRGGDRTSFRTHPPDVTETELVLRTGLLEVLAGRHEQRLVVVTGGPGFGKTTLLAQAVLQNRLSSLGVDVWVTCYPGDAHDHLLSAALLDGLGVRADRARTDLAAAVADAVWSQAPAEIALILDDFHLVPEGSGGHRLVEQLARLLPANGHLVLASRPPATLATGRHRAAGELIEIGEDQLAFDAGEQRSFAALHGIEPSAFDLRWPALAQLTVRAGPDHAVGYLWEEVLATLPGERRRALAQLSHFREIDDDLARAVTGTDGGAAALLDGLPLVASSGRSTWRVHELWCQALEAELSPAEHRHALLAGARCLLDGDRLIEAAAAFLAAEDQDGLRDTARAAVFRPLTRTDVEEAHQLHALMPPEVRASPVGVLLSAFAQLGRPTSRAIEAFELAAQLARDGGLGAVEARALWLATQLHGVTNGLPAAPHLQDRTAALAETGLPAAQAMRARHQAYLRLQEGDPDGALSHLEALDGFGPYLARLLTDQLLIDAGRAERVGAHGSLDDVEDQTGNRALDLNFALALWLRGEMDPAPAMSLTSEFVDVVESQGMPHQSFMVLAIEALVALAAGDPALAAEFRERAEAYDMTSFGAFSRGYLDLAQAASDCVEGNEAGAAAHLVALVEELPIHQWVPRTYLHTVAAVYLLVPSVRDALDDMALGPSLRALLDAARALAAIRAGERTEPSLEAAWDRPNLLRSGLWPPHLAELAVAAISTGRAPAEVRSVLDAVPELSRHLRDLSDHPHPDVVEQASQLLAGLVPEPPYRLSVRAFGPLTILMDGQPVTDAGWARRERVRRLFAYLVEHPMTERRRAAAELWPDHDPDKGLLNLRVTLSYLQKVLEPHREEGSASWFITADEDHIVLHADRLAVDAWQFDSLIHRARQAADRNVPSEALDRFVQAVDLYVGDYLAPWENEYWGSLERLRYRSQFVQAANRAGELLLARGEPEAALDLAGKVLACEPLSERAHRIRIRSLLGCDDRAGARRAGEVVVESLADASLPPEPDTATLLDRLGLDLDRLSA